MEVAWTGDVSGRQSVRRHQRRRRILAQVVELVARLAVGDEAHARGSGRMPTDARSIDALGLPQFEEGIAHPVLAEAGDVAGRSTLADGGNRHVLGIAPEALQPGPAVALARAAEFDQRLAKADDIGRGGHDAPGFPWWRTALNSDPLTPIGRTTWLRQRPSPAAPT